MKLAGLSRTRSYIVRVGVTVSCWVGLLVAPSPSWMPSVSASRGVLEVFLGAQAAIAALTLAVMIFVLQAVSARRDVDDRKYREYLRRSHVRLAFAASIAAVGFTGAALLLVQPGGLDERTVELPGLRNLLLVGAIAFTSNLVFTAYLFNKTLGLTQPGAWRALVHDINEQAVRISVNAYLLRTDRVTDSDEPSVGDVLGRDPDEGSADDAIVAILDDALRAVGDRRSGEFEAALESLKNLTEYAMSEIEARGRHWGPPGSPPRWPPAYELHRRLYVFREELLDRGGREHALALRSLDYWFMSRGIQHGCGELFTIGLDGNAWNYEISVSRSRSELIQLFVDTTWTSVRGATIDFSRLLDGPNTGVSAERLFPYMERLVHHNERLLAAAMRSGRPDDFRHFVRGFEGLLRHLYFTWREDIYPPSRSEVLYESIDEIRRVVLIGLAGRAILLAGQGQLIEVEPYVEIARDAEPNLRELADDIASALDAAHEDSFLWDHWETEKLGDLESGWINARQYPLAFFVVRLLELATTSTSAVNLHGRAREVLDWFDAHVDGLEPYASGQRVDGGRSRELGRAALELAVRTDEITEMENAIARDIDDNRVAQFVADVYASRFSFARVDQLFARYDAQVYVRSDHALAPPERGNQRFLQRAAFTATPGWAPYMVHSIGPGLEDDVVRRLEGALVASPTVYADLGDAQAVLSAIDRAVHSMAPKQQVLVLLLGDFHDVVVQLSVRPPAEYVPHWSLPEENELKSCDIEGTYRGYPVLRHHSDGAPRLYIVEPRAWGCVVRGQVEGETDLRVEIEPITVERARELLASSPQLVQDEPDDIAKVRRLRSLVLSRIYERVGFLVRDPSRARRVLTADSGEPETHSALIDPDQLQT